MKKLLFVLLGLTLVVGFVFAGAQQEQAAEKAEAEGEIVIRFAADPNGASFDINKMQAEKYMAEHPNVKIELYDTSRSTTDLLGQYKQFWEAQSGELDIYRIDVIWPGDIATHLIDLNQFPEIKEAAADHFPAIIKNNTVDGDLVGLPWFTDAGLLYYRTDLLEKYGYDGPPETWMELEEMAQKIQAGERAGGNQDFWGFVWQGDAYEGLTCDALEWVYSNGGGTIVSSDKKITINNDNAVEALEMAAGWIDNISPKGVTAFKEEEARRVWQNGNAAFMRNWPYAFSLGNADDSPIKGKFDAAPLPKGRKGGAATLGGWQLAISKYSEHPEVAADVLAFLCSYESQKEMATMGSYNPTIMDLYQDEDVLEATPIFGSLYDVFINAVARPSTATAPNYAETSRLFFSKAHDVLLGNLDADDAMEELELDLEDLLGFPTGPVQ
ncbi:MAG: ABC transporter substrate-binding protein [Sediminispirochaetaceae bacterium]